MRRQQNVRLGRGLRKGKHLDVCFSSETKDACFVKAVVLGAALILRDLYVCMRMFKTVCVRACACFFVREFMRVCVFFVCIRKYACVRVCMQVYAMYECVRGERNVNIRFDGMSCALPPTPFE